MESINVAIKFVPLKVVLCVGGSVLAVALCSVLSLFGVSPPAAEVAPLRFWESSAPLAGAWPVTSVCNASYADKEPGQAAALIGARYLEISTCFQVEALVGSLDVAQDAADETITRLEVVVNQEFVMDNSAGTLFDVGMYFSKASIISQSVAIMVKAEEFLLQGEQGSIGLETLTDRALTRAVRIHEHAELLAAKVDFVDIAAVESRYRTAAKIALWHRSPGLGARSLARLALFLADIGRAEEALKTAAEALRLDEGEPVAQYVQVSLRQSLGELRTSMEIHLAQAHLSGLAGRLGPWPELEASRAVLLSDFEIWRAVAEDGSQEGGVGLYGRISGVWHACARLGDVALRLLCLLCKATLPG